MKKATPRTPYSYCIKCGVELWTPRAEKHHSCYANGLVPRPNNTAKANNG